MFSIKDERCKLAGVSGGIRPRYGQIGRYGGVVRSYDDQNQIFFAQMSGHILLPMVLRARVIGTRSSAKSCLPGPQDGAMLRCHSNMRRSEITSRKYLATENKKTCICNFVEIMAKARAQNDHEYEPEIKFCCHAVLIGPSFKKTLAETTVFLRDTFCIISTYS